MVNTVLIVTQTTAAATHLSEPVPQSSSGDHHEGQPNRAVDQRRVDQRKRDPREDRVNDSVLPDLTSVKMRYQAALTSKLLLVAQSISLVLFSCGIQELCVLLQGRAQSFCFSTMLPAAQ